MQIIEIQAAKSVNSAWTDEEIQQKLMQPGFGVKLLNDAVSFIDNDPKFYARVLLAAAEIPSLAMTPDTRMKILKGARFLMLKNGNSSQWAKAILQNVMKYAIATKDQAVKAMEASELMQIVNIQPATQGGSKNGAAIIVMLAQGTPQNVLDQLIEMYGLGGKVLAPAIKRREEFWPEFMAALDAGAIWKNDYMGYVFAQPLLKKGGALSMEHVEQLIDHAQSFPGVFISAVNEHGGPILQEKLAEKPTLAEDPSVVKERIALSPGSAVKLATAFFANSKVTLEDKEEFVAWLDNSVLKGTPAKAEIVILFVTTVYYPLWIGSQANDGKKTYAQYTQSLKWNGTGGANPQSNQPIINIYAQALKKNFQNPGVSSEEKIMTYDMASQMPSELKNDLIETFVMIPSEDTYDFALNRYMQNKPEITAYNITSNIPFASQHIMDLLPVLKERMALNSVHPDFMALCQTYAGEESVATQDVDVSGDLPDDKSWQQGLEIDDSDVTSSKTNWYYRYGGMQKESGWKDWAASILAMMTALPSAMSQEQKVQQIAQQYSITTQQVQQVLSDSAKDSTKTSTHVNAISVFSGNIADVIKSFENSKAFKPGGWNQRDQRWHIYSDNGKPAIAYGHDLQSHEINAYDNGISDEVANRLLEQDIANKQAIAANLIPSYSHLPSYLQNAIIVGVFRGDIGKHASPKTIAFINSNRWEQAAIELCASKDYNKGGGIQKRMGLIAQAFRAYAGEIAQK